jgi:hypothetical protein
MSQSISLPGQQMPAWLKHTLLSGAVFLMCWGGIIAYWRTQQSAPGTGEILLYLFALPAGLLLGCWAGSKALRSSTSAPATAPDAQPQQAGSAPVQIPPLAILAAALRTPHGASVDELAAAIAANRARADLDRELIDDDGFPVMSARSPDAGDDQLREEASDWLSRKGMATLHFSEEQWRALTLASAVTSDLVMRATGEFVAADNTSPMLQLIPLLPADWQSDQRRAANLWLQYTASQFGWPADRIALAAQVDAAGIAPSAVFARLARAAAADAAAVPMLALVVACASHIGQQTVDEWAAKGILFTASQPHGLVPGEGAAGVLLTSRTRAESIESMAYVLLDDFADTRLDASADEVKRVDAASLGQLAETACRRAAVRMPTISMIIGDAGHRQNRVAELMGFVSAKLPQLDASDDVVRSGLATGTAGAVPFITGLALARYYVLDREASALFVSNEDAYRRSVGLVRSALALPLS